MKLKVTIFLMIFACVRMCMAAALMLVFTVASGNAWWPIAGLALSAMVWMTVDIVQFALVLRECHKSETEALPVGV